MSVRPERVIAILGMHRSGTSCLTGSLQEAGLELGEHHTWNPYNLKGNRENQDFVDLHDAVLAANGGAWDRPPSQARWSPAHREQALALLAEYADVPALGFKDPRCLLALEGWHEMLPDLERVGIFRHPEAVAASLLKRSEIPRAQALSLWYTYNRRLLREYQREPFPLLCFDDEEAVFNSRVDDVVRRLRLHPVAAPTRFYDNTLKTHGGKPGARLPWRVRYLYYRLRRISL